MIKITVRETIFQAILDLSNAGRVASRAAVAQSTGLKLTVVDDHVKTLCDDMRLRKVVNGVVEPVENFPASRPISKTVMATGVTKVEIGDELIELTPGEARILGQMFYAQAMELSMMRGEREVYDTVARLQGEVRTANKRLADMARLVAGMRRQDDLFMDIETVQEKPHGTSQNTRKLAGPHPAGA